MMSLAKMFIEAFQSQAFWIEFTKVGIFTVFSMITASLSFNQKVNLEVIEPEDTKNSIFEWKIKSTGSKPAIIYRVTGYQGFVKTYLYPGETATISSLFGATRSGGVIYYKRFRLLPGSKIVIFGSGASLFTRRKFWPNFTFEKKLPRIHAWWHIRKLIKMSKDDRFKLTAWPNRPKPSFRLKETSKTTENGGITLYLTLDYPVPAFYKMSKRKLKSKYKIKNVDTEDLQLDWYISKKEAKNIARYLFSINFTKDIKLAKDPKTPLDFLIKHLLNPNASSKRKRSIFNPPKLKTSILTMRRSTTDKCISMRSNDVHFSIRNPSYIQDKNGMLFRYKAPKQSSFGLKRRKRRFITVFVSYNGTVVTEDKYGLSNSVRLSSGDFARFMSMIGQWKS